mmetsp:Transcript_34271/g.54904  ORF Transcript_34271/g.54904 Transcript_34271/m.54904 type:complete len:565 (-) Transcript_34271:1545-3239(-)
MGLEKLLRRKPLWVFKQEADASELQREYGFWSLLAFGIGGTVGSGIFVLSGQIATNMAGPATCISWLIAGLCCAVTALAYCELAAILQSPGSTYAFSYYGLGEIYAIISAYLLTLEYGVSGAAVARSWGDKLAFWINANGWMDCPNDNCWANSIGGTSINLGACFISLLMVILLSRGVKMEKNLINILVVIKVGLVFFVIIAGAVFAQGDNLTPFVPQPNTAHNGSTDDSMTGGMNGILLGATSAFFGYIGFDEVACMSGEAKRPKRDVPLAIIATIVSITVLYVSASLVLTAMVPYDQIDQNEGFGSAFLYVGSNACMQITVIGEILVVLPTVVLVSYAPQARVLVSAALDGQVPGVFAKVNSKGTVVYSVWVSGILMTLIATFVPFANLNDLISGGILFSFILTNMSLTLTRTRQKGKLPLALMTISMGIVCFIINKADMTSTVSKVFVSIFGAASLGLLCYLMYKYDFNTDIDTFKVPGVPLVPAVAIFVNWFLLTQLSWLGLGLVAALIGFALVSYMFYGYRKSVDFETLEDAAQIESQICGIDAITKTTSVDGSAPPHV